jgi:hypothetical protein
MVRHDGMEHADNRNRDDKEKSRNFIVTDASHPPGGAVVFAEHWRPDFV